MYTNYFKDYVANQPPMAFNRIQPLPPVSETELLGQLLDWAFQYLHTKKFPYNLISSLLKQIKSEFEHLDLSTCKVKEEEDRDETKGFSWYNANDTKQKLIEKVDEICVGYSQNYNPELEFNCKQPFYEVTSASIRNSRRTLEDRLSIVPSLEHIFDLPIPTSYFAVFDGHNGSEAANYSAAQLHLNLIGLDSFPENIAQAITEACHTTDDEFLLKCITTDLKSGTTLALTLFIENKIYVAWVGDSQVVLGRASSGPYSIVNPHKPGRLDEIERITELGGEVARYDSNDTWRVNGCLAVSRAIGDSEFKKYVIPTPDVVELELDGTEEYLILATDGLWDDISPLKCDELIKTYLICSRTHEGLSLTIAEEAKKCGATDNITVIIVFLRPVNELITKYADEYAEFVVSESSVESTSIEKLTPDDSPLDSANESSEERIKNAQNHSSSSDGCAI